MNLARATRSQATAGRAATAFPLSKEVAAVWLIRGVLAQESVGSILHHRLQPYKMDPFSPARPRWPWCEADVSKEPHLRPPKPSVLDGPDASVSMEGAMSRQRTIVST